MTVEPLTRPTTEEALMVAAEHVEWCRAHHVMACEIAEAIGRPELGVRRVEASRRRDIITAALAAEWMQIEVMAR